MKTAKFLCVVSSSCCTILFHHVTHWFIWACTPMQQSRFRVLTLHWAITDQGLSQSIPIAETLLRSTRWKVIHLILHAQNNFFNILLFWHLLVQNHFTALLTDDKMGLHTASNLTKFTWCWYLWIHAWPCCNPSIRECISTYWFGYCKTETCGYFLVSTGLCLGYPPRSHSRLQYSSCTSHMIQATPQG